MKRGQFVSDKLNRELNKMDKKRTAMSNGVQICILILTIALISSGIIMYKNTITAEKLYNEILVFDDNEVVETEESEQVVEEQKQSNNISNIFVQQIAEDAVGVLEIPSANIQGIIKEGVEYSTLERYIGMFDGSAKPGQTGNCCLAAHNNTCTQIFRNLDSVTIGDIVKIRTRKAEYTYKVYDKFIVDPTQTEVLGKSNKKIVTIITCTPNGLQRIVVRGELVEE